MDLQDFAVNVVVASVLGGMIGFEREVHQRKAGLRTNILVALGSAAFVTIGAFVPHEDSQSRVAAAVVSGVGFLGAGVIFKDGATIRGLDTAATVWCSAAVGALAGWGQLVAAVICTFLILLTNTLVRPLVKAIDKQRKPGAGVRDRYRLTIVCSASDDDAVRDLILAEVSRGSVLLQSIRRTKARDALETVHHTITAELVSPAADSHAVEKIAGALTNDSRVESAIWRIDEPDAAGDGNGRE